MVFLHFMIMLNQYFLQIRNSCINNYQLIDKNNINNYYNILETAALAITIVQKLNFRYEILYIFELSFFNINYTTHFIRHLWWFFIITFYNYFSAVFIRLGMYYLLEWSHLHQLQPPLLTVWIEWELLNEFGWYHFTQFWIKPL